MNIKTATYQGQGQEVTVTVNVTDEVLTVLGEIAGPRGSFAFIRGHVSETGRTVPEIVDQWFLSQPRYDRYLERKIAGLADITLEDVTPLLPRDFFPKAFSKGLDIGDLFEASKTVLRDRWTKESPDTAANREGQAATHVTLNGFRCHVVTEKIDGLMRPVLDTAGRMTVDSIKVAFYQIAKHVHQAGVFKPVNSRPDTIMRNTIEVAISRNGVRTTWAEFSLQKHNFISISMNSAVILGWVRDIQTAAMDAAMAQHYREIGNLTASPMETLVREANETVSVG